MKFLIDAYLADGRNYENRNQSAHWSLPDLRAGFQDRRHKAFLDWPIMLVAMWVKNSRKHGVIRVKRRKECTSALLRNTLVLRH